MINWKNCLIRPKTSIREAILHIERGGAQIALVLDDDGRLLGTITDGDVRRGLLRSINLDAPTRDVMNVNPTSANISLGRDRILAIMKERHLHQIPLISEDGRVVGLETIEELLKPARLDNLVVLMAGGQGKRMRPLTDRIPKPLLPVGGRPLLELLVESLANHGLHRLFLSVNYKAEMFESHFGDGSKYGVEIQYLRESEPLGTAGALSLLPAVPDGPILVMNADLLTSVNFQQLLEFHRQYAADLTLCVREYSQQIPYGVVTLDGHHLRNIVEKPISQHFVSAGIYAISPNVLANCAGGYLDMPTLVQSLINQGGEVSAFPIREYWLDVGRIDDLERARLDYQMLYPIE